MDDKENTIPTVDGRRLTVGNDEISGTEDSGPGLAYEAGNRLITDENGNKIDSKEVDKEREEKK